MDTEKPEQQRLYQVWKGSNRFFFGGRLIFGPDVSSFFLSTILIAAPALAFCIKIIIVINQRRANQATAIPWYPVLVLAVLLTTLDMLFLFLTSSRDPGILRRNAKPPESDETAEINTPSMEWVNGTTPHLKLPRTKEVIVNGHSIKVKFCDTCLLYRPPRASHCSICNNCVQRFDHHCPWVGQCIGVRNYRYFYMFVTTSTILCLFVFWECLIHIVQVKVKRSVWKAMSADILSVCLIAYCFIAVWFVGGLTVFHFYLIATNQTTYENFRYRYDKKVNPYNKGMIKNLKEAFFSKIPPSMLDFRSFVQEDEIMVREPTDHEFMESPKEKIDIEMGSKFGEDNVLTLPEILRNIGFDEVEDDLKHKDERETSDFDRFIDQEIKESIVVEGDSILSESHRD